MAVMLIADDKDRLTLRKLRHWHRLVAHLRAGSLDRELIDGCTPEECPYLAARALQLTSKRSRHGLADGLDRLLAGRDHRPMTPAERARVTRAGAELRALRERLLAPDPVPARGVAMVCELLCDGTGPLYQPANADEVRAVAQRAVDALAR
jgi:hypothetical protein